jgi:hypothetical protein
MNTIQFSVDKIFFFYFMKVLFSVNITNYMCKLRSVLYVFCVKFNKNNI